MMEFEPDNGTRYLVQLTHFASPTSKGILGASLLFTVISPSVFASSYAFQNNANEMHASYFLDKIGGPHIKNYPTDAIAIADAFQELTERKVIALGQVLGVDPDLLR